MIIDIILVVAVLLCMGITFKKDMQMMQQNSYRNERYLKWLKMSNDATSMVRLLTMALFVFMLTPYFQWDWAKGLEIAVLLSICTAELRKKYKKPVVFTKRVWRLYCADWVFALSIMVVSFFITKSLLVVAMAGVGIVTLSFVVTMFSNWMMKPVESSINQKYYDDAKKKLSQMPDMKIVGITGSYGKTSTKHYLNRILCEKYNVLMTPGSFNTPMGVIRTVREMMQPYNDLFIVEMGAKNIGDIKEICDLVHPTMGIVTAVGPQHLESFKTIENVQRTKFELIDALPDFGLAVVNNDFPYIANRKIDNVKSIRYAVSNPDEADILAHDIEYSEQGAKFNITINGVEETFTTKLVGECNISNLTAAIIMAVNLDVPIEKIKYAVSKIEQVEHRLNMKVTGGGITIIDDAFNSNPDGSKMALDVLARMKKGKRIIITPGMIELGDKQAEYNQIFGEHISKCADIAIVVGQYNREAILKGLNSGAMDENAIHIVDTFKEAQIVFQGLASAGDTVLYENDLPDTFH